MRAFSLPIYFFLLFGFSGFLFPVKLFSQENHTLSGYIRDAETGEELIGAAVYFEEIREGGISNMYGFYSVTVPAGSYTVRYSYLGYEQQQFPVLLDQNRNLDVELKTTSRSLEEVVVTAQAADQHVRSAEMSVARLDAREIQTIPVIFGELDVLKTIQLLPGIQSAGEGNSGFYVRGGDASQNLILLDEAPVYNASHLLGFFSVFNSESVKDVTMIKGGIPAEYGGRLSSVLDVKMKEGNMKDWGLSGGVGLISSRILAEGPIKKDRGSVMLAGRRTYADLFLKLSSDTLLNSNVLYFYDLNLKANYRLGPRDRLFLSGYFGRDIFRFRDIFGFDWGNTTTTLRWNHVFNDRIFMNTSAIYSKYNYVFGVTNEGNEFDLRSSIQDLNLKMDFQYFITPGQTLRFGVKSNYHRFLPGEVSSTGDFPVNDTRLEEKYAWEHAAYISREWEWGKVLSLKAGLRFSMFTAVGPGNVFRFAEDGSVTDTLHYTRGEVIANYPNLDPRILVNLKTGPASSVKASYTHTHQYVHLLSNSTASTPLDLWIPSSRITRPQFARQAALGYFRNFMDNMLEASMEVYYKHMDHQIDYRNGADIFLNDLVESQLVFGKGWSYGAELYLRKNLGQLRGWISYTLSRTERKFDRINQGRVFPARQDRTHDISVVGMYDLSNRLSLSATWVFNTGDAVTFPSGKYIIDGQVANFYSERNGYRMPPYHRMDIGLVLENKPEKKYRSSWNFSIYNLYARKNAYSINFEQDEDDPSITRAVKLYLFSIIPSLSYQFRF